MSATPQPARVGDLSPLQRILMDGLHEAVRAADAMAGTVYLLDTSRQWLKAALVGGSPPAIYIMPTQVQASVARGYAASAALLSGQVRAIGEPEGCPADPPEEAIRVLPHPYSVVAIPLIWKGHRYGALSVIRIPERCGPLDGAGCARVLAVGTRIAQRLAALPQPVRPGRRPALIPMLERSDSEWGLPDVPGSSALTMMYQVHHLYPHLSKALGAEEVAETARTRIAAPLGAEAMVLMAVSDGRLWVVGHYGMPPRALTQLHGASSEGGSPPADAVSHDALFLDLPRLHELYPEPTPLDNCRSWAVLPLRAGGHAVGACCLGWTQERRFTAEERALMFMMADLLGSALDRVRSGEAEHALAQNLQTRLLPLLPNLPDMVTTCRYLPASASGGGVGGDWYDVIPSPGDRVVLVVGDVEGHALEAAGVMGELRGAVRAYVTEGHPPAAVLSRASVFLEEETERLATCCIIRFDPATGVTELALAGHPAPVVLHDGHVTVMDAEAGVPLGVAGEPYRTHEVELPLGATLALYTDGMSPERREDVVLAVRRLLQESYREGDRDLEGLADRVVEALPGPSSRKDDAVLLLARWDAAMGERRRISSMSIHRHDLHGPEIARAFISDELGLWGLAGLTDEAKLIVSEMVTNALIHADTAVDLRMREYSDRIRLEVRDADASPPVPSPIVATSEDNDRAEHGRGLVIVEALAELWGSSPYGRGKTVWAELAK